MADKVLLDESLLVDGVQFGKNLHGEITIELTDRNDETVAWGILTPEQWQLVVDEVSAALKRDSNGEELQF